MKGRAAMSYRAAVSLYGLGNFAGAANRIYYALYQCVVSEFDEKGFSPQAFCQADPKHPEKWPHHVVRNNASAVGVKLRERELIHSAWDLRRKADYTVEVIDPRHLGDVIRQSKGLLESLGVVV